MNDLKSFVKNMFFGLPEKLWNEKGIKYFIQKAISLDSDVYDAIIDIEYDDLYQHLAEFDDSAINREGIAIQGAMIANAKREITQIIEDIEFEREEAVQKIKDKLKNKARLVLKTGNITDAENERLENISSDNQRLMM